MTFPTFFARPLLAAALLTITSGCAGSAEDGNPGDEDEALPSTEADIVASAPKIGRSGNTVTGTGLPLLLGLKAQPGDAGKPRREFAFLNTRIPDGNDLEGHPRFPSVTFEKRVVHMDPELGTDVAAPTGGVPSGTSLISQSLDGKGGKVDDALLTKVNAELKQLWEAHPNGRFTVKMFPARNGVATTANGFKVQIVNQKGTVTAADGNGGSYDAGTEFATLEKNVQVLGGVNDVSTCEYDVVLKEAAVLANVATVGIFHIQRTLKKKTGDNIACMKSEDKYVIGTFGI
jgi:hypothetical protein